MPYKTADKIVVLCILVLEFLEKRWKEKRPIRMVASISQFNLDFHIIAFEKLISVLWYVWWNLSLLLVPVSELLPVYWITPCLSCPLPLLYICFISYCSVQYNKQNVCTLYIHLLLLLSSSPPPHMCVLSVTILLIYFKLTLKSNFI
jgi:hypothetical protein